MNTPYQQFVKYVAQQLDKGGLEDARRTARNFERNLGLDAAKLLKAAQESRAEDPRKEGK